MDLIRTKLYGTLDAQSYKKIFPEQYLTKFAAHLKVLQFQKKLFQTAPQPGKLKFTKRLNNVITTAKQAESLRPKVNISKFAKISDILLNDKEQLVRFKTFSKTIEQNLNNRQQKLALFRKNRYNEIKTFQSKQEVKLKVIDDMMVESTRQTNQNMREKLQSLNNQQVHCKFIKKTSQIDGKSTYKSKLQWNSLKKYNSEKTLHPKTDRGQNKFQINICEIKDKHRDYSLQKRRQGKYKLGIPAQNSHKILQTKSRSNSHGSYHLKSVKRQKDSIRHVTKQQKNAEIKIDLVAQTYKIKENSNMLKLLVYSTQVINQNWKKQIVQALSQNENRNSNNLTETKLS